MKKVNLIKRKFKTGKENYIKARSEKMKKLVTVP